MEPALPHDPALPLAAGLLGDGGRAIVGQFLSESGWSLCAIDPVQVFYRPGRSMLVRFSAQARRPGGLVETLTLAAECRGDAAVRVWAFPEDPSLPGLPAALQPPEPLVGMTMEMLRYRPRRRAVLRYGSCNRALFGKVLPPARAQRALRAADGLCPGGRPGLRLALPTPGPAPGALLVAPLAGRELRDLLLAGDTLPSPHRLARLPEDLAAMVRRPTSGRPFPDSPAGPRLAGARDAAALAGHLLPELGPALDWLLSAVARGIGSDPADRRPVHGDLYEGQVLVGDDGTLGLLDLDDLGLGDPLLDAATFSAHLVALALCPGAATTRILAYRAELRCAFLDRLGAQERSLRWRETYAMLLLAPGPFRALRPDWPGKVAARVEAATRLLRR